MEGCGLSLRDAEPPAEVDGWGLAGGVVERALVIESWLGLAGSVGEGIGLAGGDGDLTVDVVWCCVFDGELGDCVIIESGQFRTPSVNFSRADLMLERGDKRFEDKT